MSLESMAKKKREIWGMKRGMMELKEKKRLRFKRKARHTRKYFELRKTQYTKPKDTKPKFTIIILYEN